MSKTSEGILALREILLSMRWDDQHGYPGYLGNGKWSFVSTGLPQTTPEQLNALFKLVGIDPDVIIPLGSCFDCRYSINGQERGYRKPCISCTRPYHSLFERKFEL